VSLTGWRKLGVMAGSVLLTGSLAWTQSNSASQAKKPAQGHAKSASSKHHTSGKVKARKATHHSVHSSKHRRTKSRKTASWRRRGQQKIDQQRAREIQQALIRAHYLSGEPSGRWDAATQGALERYQSDNGWQTKTVPDARALIKLGLGPDEEHLLNPESAMTASPVDSPPNPAPANATAPRPAANPSNDRPQ
jgi:Putative peptidoglycan binding domain